MNNFRRTEIKRIINALEELKEDIDSLADEEQEYVDNFPENLQSSARYEAAEEALSNLNDAADYLDDVMDYLGEAQL